MVSEQLFGTWAAALSGLVRHPISSFIEKTHLFTLTNGLTYQTLT